MHLSPAVQHLLIFCSLHSVTCSTIFSYPRSIHVQYCFPISNKLSSLTLRYLAFCLSMYWLLSSSFFCLLNYINNIHASAAFPRCSSLSCFRSLLMHINFLSIILWFMNVSLGTSLFCPPCVFLHFMSSVPWTVVSAFAKLRIRVKYECFKRETTSFISSVLWENLPLSRPFRSLRTASQISRDFFLEVAPKLR